MPPPRTSHLARLKLLDAARLRAAKLKRGETLSMEPMRELLGISTKILRGWCDDIDGFEKSGAFVRGGHGIEWAFRPGRTITFLQRHFRGEIDRGAQKARRLRQIVGGKALAGVPDDLTLAEMDRAISIRVKLRGEKLAEGELTNAERARMAFTSYHSTIQRTVVTFTQEQDPEGRWSPEFREKIEDLAERLLVSLEDAGRKCLAEIAGR